MRRITASQKIARLERRIARLEKEASWTDWLKRFPRIRVQATKIANMVKNLLKTKGMEIELGSPKVTEEIEYGQKMVVITYPLTYQGESFKLMITAGKPSLYDEFNVAADAFNAQNIPLAVNFSYRAKVSEDVVISGVVNFRSQTRNIIKAFKEVTTVSSLLRSRP